VGIPLKIYSRTPEFMRVLGFCKNRNVKIKKGEKERGIYEC
jgi:hypothetical protein